MLRDSANNPGSKLSESNILFSKSFCFHSCYSGEENMIICIGQEAVLGEITYFCHQQ